ncbi:hypothetical protein [Devosia beringensis]|uniref:hypothetical protein n=1 Tax=Devosia beringensis TaxID=2657486 RepID=UPI00186B7C5B|nr:hypothetical protein [Devosia beringensis]
MPADNITLIGLGLAGLFIVWLVFSLVKKVFGLVLLAALVIGAYVLWNNPAMLQSLLNTVTGFFS